MSFAEHLRGREVGSARDPRSVPQPTCGVLVLDDKLSPAAFPGGPLSWVREPVHYLDLGGIQATSLRDFGGSAELWGGVTKLYANNCGLARLDGAEQLTAVLWLYLDNNGLVEEELLRLRGLPPGRLKALDISGNPGCSEEVVEALEAGGVLSALDYLNGSKWRPSLSGPRLPPRQPAAPDGDWDT